MINYREKFSYNKISNYRGRSISKNGSASKVSFTHSVVDKIRSKTDEKEITVAVAKNCMNNHSKYRELVFVSVIL